MIGPTHPFRGGISHYTTLLFRNLKRHHWTAFIAFRRQYPKWLFPGETDRDPSKDPIAEDGVAYLLDSMNPVSWVQVARKIRSIQPHLVIIPWWTSFWTLPFFCITRLTKRWTAAKILFVCHNVREHEHKVFGRICTKLVLNQGDLHLVHSGEDLSNLKKIVPQSIVIRGFHPTYGHLQVVKYNRQAARRKLNVNGKVLLFFGFVRPYKGLMHLLTAMPAMLEKLGPDLLLLIVGEGWEDEEQYKKKIEELAIEAHVRRINQYIPNEEIGLYFSATDLVVIPYSSATGSGILQLAFGCGKPVVATQVGGLADDVVHGETGYLAPPDSPGDLAAAIIKYFMEKNAKRFAANIQKTNEHFSWDHLVELIENHVEKAS